MAPALSPADDEKGNHPSEQEDRITVVPQTPAFASSTFDFVASVLMSGALVGAVGTLARVIAKALG
jgi:hypothetical protein